jgi:hypothetical protein
VRPIAINGSKWSENPEPVVPELVKVPGVLTQDKVIKIPNDSLLRNTWYMDIPSNSSQSFALLLKYKRESECYAFSGENYVEGYIQGTDLGMAKRKMPKGQYTASVMIKGDNVENSAVFRIRNEGPNFLDVYFSRVTD